MATLKMEMVEARELMAANVLGEMNFAPPSQQPVGLLLPAVQKIRDAAARPTVMPVDWNLASPPDQEAILIGLLLPAVQKVR